MLLPLLRRHLLPLHGVHTDSARVPVQRLFSVGGEYLCEPVLRGLCTSSSGLSVLSLLAEAGVSATWELRQKLVVVAGLDEHTLLNDEDLVGVLDRGEPVRNDDDSDTGDSLAVIIDSLLYLLLIDLVKR